MRTGLLLVMVLLLLGQLLSGPAHAQISGFNDTVNWRENEVTWSDMGGLPRDVEFAGTFCAGYNMGYGATVLGLNLRTTSTDSQNYIAIASCVDSQLTVLDYLGPFDSVSQWDSGPYHVAAGLPDGRLVVWLTAPREYPRRTVLAYDYAANKPFDCAVYPPTSASAAWREWEITIAYQTGSNDPKIAVDTYDGQGRYVEGPPVLDPVHALRSLYMRELEINGVLTPCMLYTTINGLYSVWHDPWKGWRRDRLAGVQLDNVRLWLSPAPAPPLALALFVDDADAYTNPTLQALTLSTADGRHLAARWGDSTQLDANYSLDPTVFISTVSSVWPLIAQATDGNIYLAWHRPDPAGREILPFGSVLLHYGERRSAGSSDVAAYPITDIRGTAHWYTGDPEIFWVQLGGGSERDKGQLFRLAYEPKEN